MATLPQRSKPTELRHSGGLHNGIRRQNVGTSSSSSNAGQVVKRFEKSLRVREHKTLDQIAQEQGKSRQQLAHVARVLVDEGRAVHHPGKRGQPATYTKPTAPKGR